MLRITTFLVLALATSHVSAQQESKLTAVRDYLATASLLTATAVSKCNLVWLDAARLDVTYQENSEALFPLNDKFSLAVQQAKNSADLMEHLRSYRTSQRELPFVACADPFVSDDERKLNLAAAQSLFRQRNQDLLTAIEVLEALAGR